MTMKDLLKIDSALAHTIDIITYCTMTCDYITEKKFLFFSKTSGVCKTSLTPRQITALTAFVACKLQKIKNIPKQHYEFFKAVYASPEICINIVQGFINTNAVMMPRMHLRLFQTEFKTYNADNEVDAEEIAKKINSRTSSKTVAEVAEKIYHLIQK